LGPTKHEKSAAVDREWHGKGAGAWDHEGAESEMMTINAPDSSFVTVADGHDFQLSRSTSRQGLSKVDQLKTPVGRYTARPPMFFTGADWRAEWVQQRIVSTCKDGVVQGLELLFLKFVLYQHQP
jgi:hypothetical protein